ncbi:MAG TPA: discoidin domain-containing protein, partial [Bacteroidota bacterium]
MLKHTVTLLLLVLAASAQEKDALTILDPCDDTLAWKTFHSAGVTVSDESDRGIEGGAIRFDVEFTKGSGYGGVTRNFNVALPEDYEITFVMRATVPVNNFEFKVSNDSAGEDIWWVNKRNFEYPTQWKRIVIKKRHLSFAWGPRPAPKPDALKRMELVVTAGKGGKGSVWIDDLRLIPLEPPPRTVPVPVVSASSNRRASSSVFTLDSSEKGDWKSSGGVDQWIECDYRYRREFGAVRLDWANAMRGLDYDILCSDDGRTFDTTYAVRDGKGGSVILFTPESEARFIRLAMHRNGGAKPFRLHRVELISSDSLSTPNQYFETLAAVSKPGWYPRYFSKQASYWTVVGVASDKKEALINEDGAIEIDKQCLSLEPFVRDHDGRLLSWANAKEEQGLTDGYLPIPTVTRIYDGCSLSMTCVADGKPDSSYLLVRYTLRNVSPSPNTGSFYIALRPFQVNPTYQWLNT